MSRRGQSWSVDVVLAVVIFGFVATAITSFTLLNEPDVDTLQQDAQRVEMDLQSPIQGCGTALQNGTLNNDTLECLYGKDYEQIKKKLRLKSDFCLYLEDENGQVIPFNGKNGWGSSEVELAGQPCGT